MTDQEKLPNQRTLVSSLNKTAKAGWTQIQTIINGEDELIDNGGSSTNPNLSFVGRAMPDQYAQILDNGVACQPPSWVDSNHHFSAYLPDQTPGEHAYSAETPDGQVSDVWHVFIGRPSSSDIDWVTGPDGVPIEREGATLHTSLSFVGRGVADQMVDLLDNGELIQSLYIDNNQHWSALVEDLSLGRHEFKVRGQDGVVSIPWAIEVKKPAPLGIQFVIGSSVQLIGNHEQTTDTKVTLVGTANPGERGLVVDYENDLVAFEADQNGVFTATIFDLSQKVHTFRVKTDSGRISLPWVIRVIPAKAR